MRARDIKPGMGLIYNDHGRTCQAIALDRPVKHYYHWTLVPISLSYSDSSNTDVLGGQVFYALAKNLSKVSK